MTGSVSLNCSARTGSITTYFYGAFAGRERITELIDVWFYKDADDFRWNMVDPVFDGQTLYARYLFSFKFSVGRKPRGSCHVRRRLDHENP